MKRSIFALLAVVLAVAVAVGPTVPLGSATAPGSDPTPPSATEVVGSGPELACLGCVATGAWIAAGGAVRIFKAAITRGSSLALVGCVASCASAFGLVE